MEGALGDQSVEGAAAATPEAFARAVSDRVASLPAGPAEPVPPLAYAAVDVALPDPAPGAVPAFLRRAVRNLGGGLFPSTGRVEAVRIGDAVLVAVPAEPVAAVAARWRESLPPGAEIVSLTGGYLGYVEAPERVSARGGETVRTYYGPALAARLGDAVRLAAERVTAPPLAIPARAP
jgi:hypothetical protein